ncbi:MAG: tRNA 4-thiouridine(8) synthase ThiI [Nitrospinae bacterium CG11_big_fil_rev_8_21_14_0_20_45_15]|nr:MAG: tRNA 4-thiouridine(8) synthase ThiI [Nitrospinae bacterium CG11_big_fil_rev_8_21_14_0_20_45_15]
MNEARTILVRYDEIGLKGKNRGVFEQKLVSNIRQKFGEASDCVIYTPRGRILIETNSSLAPELAEKLAYVPGIASYSVGEPVHTDLDSMVKCGIEKVAAHMKGLTSLRFCVRSRRSDKRFELTSPEIDFEVGSRIMEALADQGLKVDLHTPEYMLEIEVGSTATFLYDHRRPGIGGLPVGSAGNVLCLLSGGIDSPVSAFQLMRRGCQVHFVFFDNRPFLGGGGNDKVRRLTKLLNLYQGCGDLHIVPFEDIQVSIRDKCHPKNRIVLYRRMMYRIAERLAKRIDCLGLVNGESLGQVASQTLENIHAVSQTVSLSVFRPLIGMDKRDIVNRAKQIGTFNVSIETQPDCCSVFMPQRPATRAKIKDLEYDETRFPMEELMEKALNNIETVVP